MGGTPGAPPLGHCPRDVINLKNAPTLGHSQAPPLGHCPCDVIHIFQGWNKIAKGWNKIAKGWNKIAKGWNKIFGMGNWGGGSSDPPPTPPGYGPAWCERHYRNAQVQHLSCRCLVVLLWCENTIILFFAGASKNRPMHNTT